MLCLIHPNVAVMWNKVQCKTCAIWCNATCDVMQCQMVLRNVVRRGMMVWYVWNMVVCCDAICEMWLWNIPSDVEWFDTLLDMAR